MRGSSYAATGARKDLRTLARLAVRRNTRAKVAATMTAAGRLGRLAALLLLPALARGWDWSTNVESTFDCETHRNPIRNRRQACRRGSRRSRLPRRGRRRHPRATASRNPSSSSLPAHNSTHYNSRAFVLAASKALAIFAELRAERSPRTHASKPLDGAAIDE